MDWFGYDFYSSDSTSWAGAYEAYQNNIFSRFGRPDQRVVPTTLSNTMTAEADDFCVRNALQWLKLGLTDARVAAVFTLTLDKGKPLGPGNDARCSKLYQVGGWVGAWVRGCVGAWVRGWVRACVAVAVACARTWWGRRWAKRGRGGRRRRGTGAAAYMLSSVPMMRK